MDKKKDIKKLYNSKLFEISKYNKSYFDLNESLVTDEKYDELKKEILELEIKYDFLISENSPSKKNRI